MDLDLTPTPTPTPTPTKSPEDQDTEIDTPPRTQSHPTKPLSYATGVHKHLPIYKECMKNHAASIGAHAVDGCGEYMPSPNSLTCAACGCHRNFHRRELDLFTTTTAVTPPFLNFRRPLSPSPPPHTIHFRPHTFLTLNTAVTDQDHGQAPVTPSTENIPGGRKRFRTKFSPMQKEKMYCFSEKVGWKMQRCDEVEVEEFCKEVGVTKGVLRVWMHNNKNKKDGVINGTN